MRGVHIHGVLLLVAVLLALPTWTRERSRPTDIQGAVIWNRDTTDLVSVTYRAGVREVAVTRRADEDGSFYWGREVLAPSDSAATETDTLSYPVGVAGGELTRGYAELRVVRDLGMPDADEMAAYGLENPQATIALEFTDGARTILLGDSVYGGSDRYATDPSTGRTFVLPAAFVRPLRLGYGSIRERSIHAFQEGDVGQVRLQALGGEREMIRTRGAAGAVAWNAPTSPGRADLTFANFMERVGQLAITGFEDEVPMRDLERFLRIDYSGQEGQTLGFLELFRHVDSGAYYLRSERTRVPAGSVAMMAQRVEEDLPQIF